MKKFMLGAAAALAIVTPGVAAAETSGNVAFSFNSLDDDSDTAKEDYLAFGGTVVTETGNGWNLQFDGEIGDMNHSGHTDTFTGTAAHLFTRNDSYAFGGFAGYTSAETNGWYVGAEGAVYHGRFTFDGNVLIGRNRESDEEQMSVAAAGDYFFTDNFSAGVDANWYEWDFGAGPNQDGTVYGVNTEYQFNNSGFSVFAGYHTGDLDNFGTDADVDSFTIGGRWNFGTSSLIERDRNGASMSGGGQLMRDQIFSW